MCERCKAVKPTTNANSHDAMSYKNMAPVPPYARTQITHFEYVQSSTKLSPWMSIPGFSLETVSYDLLHVIYLGTARDHVPSMLLYMKLRGFAYEAGETAELYLKRISIEMRADCKAQGPLGAVRNVLN